MNIRKTILFTTLFAIGTFAAAMPVDASGVNCTNMYGGTYTSSQSCAKIVIDKKVLKPGTKDYVDGLSATDPKYGIDQNVTFKVVIHNVGDETLTNINVVDVLPQNVMYVSGAGEYNKDRNELTFKIGNLEVGKSQEFFIVAKTTNSISFGDKGFVCVTNIVRASADKSITTEDTAQFCVERPLKVEKPVLGVKETPSTGPEALALPILMSMAGAGFLLRKVK